MGVDQAYVSRRRMSGAPIAKVRGRCLTRRRSLTTRTPRHLVGASVSVARRAGPRGGMAICATRRFTSAATSATAEPFVCVRLSPGRAGTCRWLTRWARRVAVLRKRRTDDAPAPRRLTRPLTGDFRASTVRPTVRCLSINDVLGRDASMRPSSRFVASARATRSG